MQLAVVAFEHGLCCSGNGAIVGLNLYTLLLSWGITEVIRYAFYAAKDLGSAPGLLTWLRYTTFIVLYPLGVASELAMVALAVPIIRQNDLLKYPMPNNFNMAFDYSVAVLLVALCYVPGAFAAPLGCLRLLQPNTVQCGTA